MAERGAPRDNSGERLPQEVPVVRCFLHTPKAPEQMFGTLSEWHPQGPRGQVAHTLTFYCRDRNGRLNWKRQTGKELPHGRIFTVWSLESLTPDSDGSAENTIFKRATHTGGVETRVGVCLFFD